MLRSLVIFLSLCTSLHGDNDGTSKRFNRVWQTEDGLPDNSVSTIAQSPEGYLWISTNGGVIRFNGDDFSPLPLRDIPGLPSRQVHAMALDRSGHVWMGMERGPIIRIGENSFRVFSEEDGQKALEGIPMDKPDVVLSDINLPSLNGVECVRGLKRELPKVQFVMITVYEDSNRIFKALEAGATGYLLKQTPRDQLLASLREVHQGGSPMSSGIARKVVQCFRKAPPVAEENELSQLSKREEEVLNLLAQGYLCKEISDSL